MPAGGSVKLGQLIDEHGPALLYDLQAIGVDLRDLWRDGTTVTPRYVLWLVEQLPESSATVASMRGGPQHRSWTTEAHLQAATVNLLFAANRQRANKPTRKFPVEPPKTGKRKPRRTVTVAQVLANQRRKAAVEKTRTES